MTTRSNTYTAQQLGATGFAIQDCRAAWRLRRDLWPTEWQCRVEFRRTTNVDAAVRMQAVLEGLAPTTTPSGAPLAETPTLILALSTVRLAERIEELTGYKVRDLKPAEPEKPVEPGPTAWQQRLMADMERERERLEQLARVEAAEGTVNWQQAQRARAELARRSK